MKKAESAGDIFVGHRSSERAARDVLQDVGSASQFLTFVGRMADEDASPVRDIENFAGRSVGADDLQCRHHRRRRHRVRRRRHRHLQPGVKDSSIVSDSIGASWRCRGSDLVDAGLDGHAGVGRDANSIQQKNAVSAPNFIFAIRREVVLDKRSRQPEGNATGHIGILIGASASKRYALRFFEHRRAESLKGHGAGRRDVLIEE